MKPGAGATMLRPAGCRIQVGTGKGERPDDRGNPAANLDRARLKALTRKPLAMVPADSGISIREILVPGLRQRTGS